MNDPKPSVSLSTVPANIPVFNCIVLVQRDSSGTVTGRVANLPDLVCTAATERDLLAKVVKEFKHRLKQLTDEGVAIPWVEPPTLKETNEQTRMIPVHL